MRRIIATSLVSLMMLTLVVGCWSRRELNDLAIAAAIGIDKKDGQYLLSAQIINTAVIGSKTGASRSDSPVTTFQETGKTIMEGFRRILTKMPREIYFAHLRLLIISEDVAREGIKDCLDYFLRNHEFRNDFYVIIAKEASAGNVLQILTPIELTPANSLYNALEKSSKNWAPTTTVRLDDLINALLSPGREATLTGVEIDGNPEEGRETLSLTKTTELVSLQYKNIGIFKKDKLVGWLNEAESKGYNYITDKVKRTIGYVSCPNGGRLALEILRSNTSVKGKVRGGKPEIDINIFLEVDVGEVACSIDLTKTEVIHELENLGKKKTEGFIYSVIQKTQSYKSDIFGFGEAIHRANPKAWKKLKLHWDQHFSELPVHLKIDYKIRRTGTQANSFLKEMEKEKEKENVD